MKRSIALTLPVALAACFGLIGCTIYTYPAQPPHKPGKAKPAPVATAKRPGGFIGGGKRPNGTPGDNTTPEPETPTVTGQTIFGGPMKTGIRGLAYVIPEGTARMPNFDDLVPFAVLYTSQLNIPSQTFSGGFPGALQQDEWFGIQYTGTFQVPAAGKFTFSLTSDDGAILYIDGRKAIDNDGVHTAKSTSQQVDLAAGSHALKLDYFQEKKGTVALQLLVNIAGKDVPVVAYP
jgi:hypothetical protein